MICPLELTYSGCAELLGRFGGKVSVYEADCVEFGANDAEKLAEAKVSDGKVAVPATLSVPESDALVNCRLVGNPVVSVPVDVTKRGCVEVGKAAGKISV